ncbi:MAG: hypothetical protein WCQ50_12740 [Spirochaetota bacterium]
MKSERSILVPLFIALAIGASVSATDFSSIGMSVAGTRTENGTDWTLLDDGAGEIVYSAQLDPDAKRLSTMGSIIKALRATDGLTISRLEVTNNPDQLRITVFPKTFVVEGQNLRSAVPGGLSFWYAKNAEYDFRVISGAYAIRMSGLFTTMSELVKTVKLAWTDPVAFLLQRDPQYAVRRITEISIAVDTLRKDLEDQATKTATNFEETRAALDAASSEAKSALEAAIEEQTAALAAASEEQRAALAAASEEQRAALETASSEQTAALAASDEKNAAEFAAMKEAAKAAAEEQAKQLEAAFTRIESAIMASLNTGFFRGPTVIPPDKIAWVVAQKTENPDLNTKALVAVAKAAKYKITDQEISIILLVKFGQQ